MLSHLILLIQKDLGDIVVTIPGEIQTAEVEIYTNPQADAETYLTIAAEVER